MIRYGDWLPVGNRFVPGLIEMRLGDRLLFSAQGRVVSLPMDESLFTPQPGAWQMGGPVSIIRDSSTDAPRHSDLASPTAADPSLKKRPSGTVFVRRAAQCPTTEMPDQAGSAQVIFEVDKRVGFARLGSRTPTAKKSPAPLSRTPNSASTSPTSAMAVPSPLRVFSFTLRRRCSLH